MLRVSGLGLPDLNPSEHSDQVKKLLKYLADVCRKMEERHQVYLLPIMLKQSWCFEQKIAVFCSIHRRSISLQNNHS